ncbi:hypothetical protein B484DRAFT_431342 [Ochromonadaceae sp. CCMP2298]|nr:hypothetical protein B484DRAFT_431342 [Ochromonadaceae sp. CCMP2298]
MGHLYKTNHLQRNFFKNCSEVAIKAVLDSGKFDLAFAEAEIPSVHAKMKRVWKSLSEDEKTQAEQGYWWAIGRLRPDAAMRFAGLFECITHSSTSSGVITVQVNIERARMVFGLLGLGPVFVNDSLTSIRDKRRQFRFLGLKVAAAVTAEDRYTDALFGGATRQLRVKLSIEEKLLQRRAHLKAYNAVYRSEHKEYFAVKKGQWHADNKEHVHALAKSRIDKDRPAFNESARERIDKDRPAFNEKQRIRYNKDRPAFNEKKRKRIDKDRPAFNEKQRTQRRNRKRKMEEQEQERKKRKTDEDVPAPTPDGRIDLTDLTDSDLAPTPDGPIDLTALTDSNEQPYPYPYPHHTHTHTHTPTQHQLARSVQGDSYKVVVVFSHEGVVKLSLREAVQRQLKAHVLQYLDTKDDIVPALLATKGTRMEGVIGAAVVPGVSTIKPQTQIQTKTNAGNVLPLRLIAPFKPGFKVLDRAYLSGFRSSPPGGGISKGLSKIIKATLELKPAKSVTDGIKFDQMKLIGDKIVDLQAAFLLYGKGEKDLTNAIKPFTKNEDGAMLAFYTMYVKPLVPKSVDPKADEPNAHTCVDIVEAMVGLSVCDSKYSTKQELYIILQCIFVQLFLLEPAPERPGVVQCPYGGGPCLPYTRVPAPVSGTLSGGGYVCTYCLAACEYAQ